MTRLTHFGFVALATAITAAPVAANPASLSRSTRPVTDAEIAGGAPVGGFVHDFFITSESDLLIVEGDADVPIFQHTLGSDVAPPWGETALIPGITADSFITLPSGQVSTIGGFGHTEFTPCWYDIPDTGPQTDFHFARLTTVGQTGAYSGQIFLRSHAGFGMPFTFVLPATEADMHLLASEGPYVPAEEVWYTPAPAAPTPGPTPQPTPAPVNPPAIPPTTPPTPAQPAAGPQVSLARHSRAVTAEEIAAGAPANGFVHEFFATADSDLQIIGDVEITAPIFQHTMGSDVAAATAESAALDPALAADSFIRLPASTASVGGGFAGGPGDQAWYDMSDDGAQADFLFARLTTTGETGSFSGQVFVRSHPGEALPFDFVLPGTENDIALLASEPAHVLALEAPPAPPIGPAPAPLPIEPAPPVVVEPVAERPLVVELPAAPIIDETAIGEVVSDPTTIDIDRIYPEITIGYDPPRFHEHWLWYVDPIDFTLIDYDNLQVHLFPYVAYGDADFLVTDSSLVTTSTGQSVGRWKSDAGVFLGAIAATAGTDAGVPEPSTAVLACLGLLGPVGIRRHG